MLFTLKKYISALLMPLPLLILISFIGIITTLVHSLAKKWQMFSLF